MIAGQLDLLDALAAEPERKPTPALPPRHTPDMTRCERCHRPATTRVVTATNLLLLGVRGSRLANTFRYLVVVVPACDACTPWYVDLRTPDDRACRSRRITWTTPTTETR